MTDVRPGRYCDVALEEDMLWDPEPEMVWTCRGCRLRGGGTDAQIPTRRALWLHLKRHVSAGHLVPLSVFRELRREMTT